MSDQDMDTQEQQVTETVEETTELSPYENLLKEITDAEGRQKYKSVEDALLANKHAQSHISTLEQENNLYKQENSRMEELLSQLSTKESQATTEEEAATTTQTESPKPEEGSKLTKDDLFAEFEARMSEKQKQAIQEENKRKALEQFQSVYADKSADTLKNKAEELGVSTEYLLNMAATSPKLFSTTMGVSSKSKSSSDWSSSSVNSSAIPNQQSKPEVKGNPLRSTRAAIDFWENNC